MMNEWVTVIALCYNHSAFLEEALDSIQHQTYPYIELIIVDDASTDDSVARIQQWIEKNNKGTFIKNSENIGNCKSFNKAFKQSKGAFIIDFSLDDVMMHDKIEKQFLFFKNQPAEVGVL
jgi:glycosyltransferase involved in cell wall biosynthesis